MDNLTLADLELAKLMVYIYFGSLVLLAIGFIWIFWRQSRTRFREQWKAPRKLTKEEDDKISHSGWWSRDPWEQAVRRQAEERRQEREEFWNRIFWWRR